MPIFLRVCATHSHVVLPDFTAATCLQHLLLLSYAAVPPSLPPCPPILLLFPRSLLNPSAIDYTSTYHVMTRFGLCLWVVGIMAWVGFFFPLLGTNKTFSPPLQSIFTQYIRIYVFETSMLFLMLGKISKQIQEKNKDSIPKPGYNELENHQ